MQRTILMILTTMLLSGCVGFLDSPYCEGPRSSRVKIHYGDSELKVTPRVANVRQTGDFVLTLHPNKRKSDPDGVDYDAVEVTVVGTTADAKVWIPEQKESYDSATNHQIVYCVPANQATVEYEYDVKIDKVGNLDPRVKVKK